jgi:chitinase
MIRRATLLATLLLAGCASVPTETRYEIVGYYPGWKGPVEVDASLLTVVNYAFLDISPADGRLVLTDAAVDEAHFARLAALKAKHPHLRLVASVGGWTRSNHFSDMAASAATRRNFVGSVLAFLTHYDFDGIDIDWEYPGAIGVPCEKPRTCDRPEDKRNFVQLARELRAALDAQPKKYLVTIAAGNDRSFLFDGASSQWMADLAASLDWVNLMTYDYHGTWEKQANFVAPLLRDPADPAGTNVDASVTMYLDAGVPARKLTLGMPFYAKGWVGCAPGPNGDGLYQPCERSLADEEVEANIRGVLHRSGAAHAPYRYDPASQTFISHDDEVSVREKSRYAASRGLLGAMYWEIAVDRDRALARAVSSELPR